MIFCFEGEKSNQWAKAGMTDKCTPQKYLNIKLTTENKILQKTALAECIFFGTRNWEVQILSSTSSATT